MERFLLTLGLLILGWVFLRAFTFLTLTRRTRRGLLLPEFRLGIPAILYFSSPDCTPCETIQRPVLNELSNQFKDQLQIFEFDANQHPSLADAWGVLSLPTTFIIDSKGRARTVNHSPADYRKLTAQLHAVEQPGQGIFSTSAVED